MAEDIKISKNWIWVMLAVVLSVLASVISVYYFFPSQFQQLQLSANQNMINSEMMTGPMMNSMREMMGANFENLPTKKPSDRTAQLAYTEKNGVKEFRLTAVPIKWEYANGQFLTAWGYNGQVPGPEIRVTEGERVRIIFTNNLPKATTIHWHGINVPYDQDGVPGVSQRPIQPGETYTYEFEAKPAGTRFYHTHGSSHQDEAQQLDMGLYGAFIIEPKNKTNEIKYDREYTLLLDEWEVMPDGSNVAVISGMMGSSMTHSMNYNLFTINGRAFPDSEPLQVKPGEKILVRLINAGTSTSHPMHLHGHSFKVVAVDGNAVPEQAQLTRDTITLNPGERYDIEITADNAGRWVLHCHELHHADGGMIVPFVYEGFSATIEKIESTPSNVGMGHGMHG